MALNCISLYYNLSYVLFADFRFQAIINNTHALETIVGTVSHRTYWPGQVMYVALYFVMTNYVSSGATWTVWNERFSCVRLPAVKRLNYSVRYCQLLSKRIFFTSLDLQWVFLRMSEKIQRRIERTKGRSINFIWRCCQNCRRICNVETILYSVCIIINRLN
jgi:hypothetical protein